MSAVLGLFSLFTMNNLFRRESDKQYVRICSTAAIVMNIVWVLPWILAIWGVFDSPYNTSTVTLVAKIIVNGIVSAIILTIFAEYLGFEDYTPTIKYMKYITLGLTAIVGGYTLIQMNASSSIFSLGSGFYQLLSVMVVILIFLLIVTPVLVKTHKRKMGLDKKVVIVNQLTPADEAALKEKFRAEIEAELRAKIEKEVRAELSAQGKSATAEPAAPATEAPATPAEEPKKDEYTFSA